MSETKILTRDQIDQKYKWNAESVFPDQQALEAEFQAIPAVIASAAEYRGRLSEGPQALKEALARIEDLFTRSLRLFSYTNIAYSVDTQDQEAARASSRARGLMGQAFAAASFLNPELIQIGKAKLETWLEEDPDLAVYRHLIEDLFRKQAHFRSAEVEEILGMLADPFGGVNTTYHNLTDADLTFKPARAETGEAVPFTSSTYGSIISSPDRETRRTAYESYTDSYLAFKNTLASNLVTSLKQNVFYSRARRHKSSLQMALFENNIPEEVFHNLIDTFRANLPTWHRYWSIRRRALKVDQLHPYDTWAPLIENKAKIPYEQSVEWVAEGLKPLGEEYAQVIRRGCLEQRWVDVYPNQGKTAGAFSSISRGTYPFIKMNYDDSLFSLSTLAHELGHSMHTYLASENQPVIYSRYSIFLAEVASNFHQAMVRAYLLENQDDPQFQIGLIEEAMYNYHRYFFQMPTLARFELETHTRIERGQGLSASDLNELMADLFAEGYGSEMAFDRERVGITWATFLHMYMDYYVYQYATGIAGAQALANRVLTGGSGAAEAYLGFLKAGGSAYPLDILREAGVDLASPEPVQAAFDVMSDYIDRLEKLVGQQ
jgi:oligoendopeptidase F